MEDKLSSNYEKIAKHNTEIIIANAFLNFAPTFIFGIIIFSFFDAIIKGELLNKITFIGGACIIALYE